MASPRRISVLAALFLVTAAQQLTARELHWRAIDVAARLESDGSLRVDETQAMVFTGDWNGGQRQFRFRFGQTVEVLRIVRVDPASGSETELVQGDLDEVDHWKWTSSDTVRWRSRRPSDPPFSATAIDYRLELVYRGILKADGERHYVLDHDFLFSDRDGDIGRVTLALELAPGWSSDGATPDRLEDGPLAPGAGFVVTRRLHWTGAGRPAAALWAGLPAAWRWGALLLLAGVAAERWLWWRRRDGDLGRFESLPTAARIDRVWLEQKVFALSPEVVGAAWDRSIGSAEVAATLTRLVAGGQLESRVEPVGRWIFKRQVLYLKRKVPLSEIDEPAQPLIAALFPSGDETDTDSLRAHYRASGFDPVSKLRAGLERRVAALRGFEAGSAKPSWRPTALWILSGFALLVFGAIAWPGGALGIVLGVLLLTVSLPGWITAAVSQAKVGVPVGALAVIAVALLLDAGLILGFTFLPGLPKGSLVGATLFACGAARAFFNLLAARESAPSMARRRELTAAHDFFLRELAQPRPALEDRWLPWLVAFGLAPSIDLWIAAHGDSVRSAWPVGGGVGSSFPGGSPWSGGGGAFGGAGATASFASAVSTLAAGVPAPGSSGGSSGGGGGSSGGGGGGGW